MRQSIMSKKKNDAGGRQRPEYTPESVILARRRRLRDLAMLGALIRKLLLFALILLILFGAVFGIAPMKGSDMEPRLSQGDLLLYYRLEKNPVRNDVVIMKRGGSRYVGRLIGMPGDTVNISNGGVISINGNNIMESDIYYETKPYQDTGRYPLTLADNEYFLLGDKRDTAKDSRYFGAVEADEIKGKVIMAIRRTGI